MGYYFGTEEIQDAHGKWFLFDRSTGFNDFVLVLLFSEPLCVSRLHGIVVGPSYDTADYLI